MRAVSPDNGYTRPLNNIMLLSVLTFSITLSACRQKVGEIAEQTHDSVYVKKGNMIVSATFDSLRNSLLRSIGTDGLMAQLLSAVRTRSP